MVKAVNRSLHALESQSQNDTGDEKDETKVLRFSGLDASIPRSSFDARIRGFTFAYFTIVMATGGLSAMLSRMPENYRCTGTDVLGKIIFIAAIIVYCLFHALLSRRFWLYPKAFKTFLQHPVESSYLCAWHQAGAVILSNIVAWGIPQTGYWLVTTMVALWVFNSSTAILFSITLPLVHFLNNPNAQKEMPTSFMLMPTLIIYSAGIGSSLLPYLSPVTGIWVFWGSYVQLGYGTFLWLLYLSLFFVKLLSGGLYEGKHALSSFMIVGMTSYTAQGFLNLAVGARTILPAYSRAIGKNYLGSLATSGGVPNTPDGTDDVATVVFLVNLSLGLLFYGFSIYCLLVSATMSLSVYIGSFTGRYEFCPSMSSMFSVAFPTTGIIVDTWLVARLLGETNSGNGARWLNVIGLVMLFVWLIGYLAALAGTIYKIKTRQILWEGKDDNAPQFNYLGEFEYCDPDDRA